MPEKRVAFKSVSMNDVCAEKNGMLCCVCFGQVVVHNLPWSCTWQTLKEVFSQWEVVRADVIVDEYGRSRGFGTVRFSSEEDAAAAIDAINGIEMDGRKITVRLDRYA